MHLAQRVIPTVPRWAYVPSREVCVASALICAASSALALAQALFAYYPLPIWSPGQTPGLFFNPVHAGESIALTILALAIQRLYWPILALLPGLYLAHSRGAWAALVLGLLATRFRHPLWLLILILALALVYTLHPSSSDLQRLQIWHAAWTHLSFWGNGLGSFMSLYIGSPRHIYQPEYVHNDYLQTVFEFGVWSVIPFGLIALALRRTSAKAWPLLVAFLFIACFSFPLHMPIPLLLGATAFTSTLLGRI